VLPKNSTPQLLLVRPAGFEPRLKSSGISLTLSPPEADFGYVETPIKFQTNFTGGDRYQRHR
jgi:hypothetical protein